MASKEKKIPRPLDVLPQYRQGAAFAAMLAAEGKKSSGGKKKGKSKRKLYYPPKGGWNGYSGGGKAMEIMRACGWGRD